MNSRPDEWVDLTLTIHPKMAKMPFLPCSEVERLSEQSETSLQVSEVSLATHIGTHVDAASHAISSGSSVEEYGPERWVGTAIVCDVEARASEAITIADLEPFEEILDDVEFLIIRTGWEELVETEEYYNHPYLSTDLTEWITQKDLLWVGMDFLTPDRPPELRSDEFTYPAHTTLLSNDTLIIENLTNLKEFSDTVIDIAALPLKIANCDGAPIRAVGREANRY